MNRPLVGYHVMTKPQAVGTVGSAYNYELAGNGVWVWAIGPHIWARVPVAAADVRGLNNLEPLFTLQHGPIPARLFDLVYSIFLAAPEVERYVIIVWDASCGEYRLEYPGQIGSAARVEYAAAESAVLEIHSHPTMAAHFSTQDDRDEQGLRVYGVVGHLAGAHAPELRLRVGVYGYFHDLNWDQVFDGTLPPDMSDAAAREQKEISSIELSFDQWYEQFQVELASMIGCVPNGMDKESYRESYEELITPRERADQEIDDLARSG